MKNCAILESPHFIAKNKKDWEMKKKTKKNINVSMNEAKNWFHAILSTSYCFSLTQFFPLLTCTWFLTYLVWKIELDKFDFLSRSNFIFTAWLASLNQKKKSSLPNSIFQTRNFKIQVQIDRGFEWLSELIFSLCKIFGAYNSDMYWKSSDMFNTFAHCTEFFNIFSAL